MSRIRTFTALAVVASLVFASAALATTAATTVTGGTTTLTVTPAVSSALTSNHLTVTPLAPATASGSTFTFPISRGHLTSKLRGYVANQGGLMISNGKRVVRMRRLTVYSSRKGVSLFAVVSSVDRLKCKVPGAQKRFRTCKSTLKLHIARIARITDVTVSHGTATGTVDLTRISVAVINSLAGKKIATDGMAIGTATVAPTLG